MDAPGPPEDLRAGPSSGALEVGKASSLGAVSLAVVWVERIGHALPPTLLDTGAFSHLDKTSEAFSTGPGQAVHRRTTPNGP